jgi:hypothetical protein
MSSTDAASGVKFPKPGIWSPPPAFALLRFRATSSRLSSIGPDHLAVRLSRFPKKCFLPNEPKVVQCLPRFLKNKVLTNRIKTVSKPI